MGIAISTKTHTKVCMPGWKQSEADMTSNGGIYNSKTQSFTLKKVADGDGGTRDVGSIEVMAFCSGGVSLAIAAASAMALTISLN